MKTNNNVKIQTVVNTKPYWVWCADMCKYFNMNREGRDANGVVKYYKHIPPTK